MNYKELYENLQGIYTNLQLLFQEQLKAKDIQLQELTNRIKELSDRIDYLSRQLYGSKSEKSKSRLPKNTLSATAPAVPADPGSACNSTPTSAPLAGNAESAPSVADPVSVKRTTVERRAYDHLMVHEVILDAAPHPNDATFVGFKETVRLRYIPAMIVKTIYKRPVYVKEDVFYTPELPEMPIDKCYADSTLLAAILTQKYRYHLPLERQLAIFQSLGVEIAKSTFNNWATRSLDLLKPLTDELRKIILSINYLHADETTLPILLKGESNCKKGYLWGLTSAKEKLVWFHYDNGERSQKCLSKILQDYTGAIQSDDCKAYQLLEKGDYKHKIITLSCLAHIRRKVFESISTDSRAQALFNLIDAIYHQEHLWQKENQQREASGIPPLTPLQISEIRKRDEYPIMRQLYRLLQQYSKDKSILPKSNLGKAVRYALNEATGILRCLKNGEYALDNNAIERQFKDMILGRKNYLFCEGHSSAERAAAIYSLIGCCKLNNIDPYQYLADVLKRINGHCHKKVAELLPHNWKPLEK